MPQTRKKKRPTRPPAEQQAVPQPVRLQQYLAASGIGSRRECEELITTGRVSVDGETVTELGTKVDPKSQKIQFDGEAVAPESKVYWFVNKPKGVICTNCDPQNRPIITNMIPNIGRRVYSVGRLDENSTGLILLTNDGELAHRLTHPRYNVPKTYNVLVAGKVANETLSKLRSGVWLAEGKVRAASITRLHMSGRSTRLRIVLCDGKNREIRRMLARFGHKVMQLERIAIGPIKSRQLKPGHSRQATDAEVEMLRGLLTRKPGNIERRRRPAPTKPQSSSRVRRRRMR